MSFLKSIGAVSAAAAFSIIAFASSAMANVITVGGVATVTCTPSCSAIVGGSIVDSMGPGGLSGTMGSLSASLGDLYSFSPSNPAEEALALNVLAGTSFTSGDATENDAGGLGNVTFSTTAQWIVMKLGTAGTFFLFNPVGTLQVAYAKNGLMGGGLSHYTEFGTAPPIPVPAALWLMGAGLAGLGFARRKKT